MTKFLINKIIRDKVYERYEKASNIHVEKRNLTEAEMIKELKEKLVEESREVLAAEEKNHIAEEIGDVIEVIEAIASRYDIKKEEILAAQSKKKEENGGFTKGVFVNTITFPEEHPMHAYHKANSHKYPEV